jgi:hypothetical protein
VTGGHFNKAIVCRTLDKNLSDMCSQPEGVDKLVEARRHPHGVVPLPVRGFLFIWRLCRLLNAAGFVALTASMARLAIVGAIPASLAPPGSTRVCARN